MTTKHSPRAQLKAQADKVAGTLKAAERGDKIEGPFAEKVAAARAKGTLKFAVVMDDKVITVEMPWSIIQTTTEAGLADYIFDQMREARHVVN